jgi:hypothetical protein
MSGQSFAEALDRAKTHNPRPRLSTPDVWISCAFLALDNSAAIQSINFRVLKAMI